jgi:hypothetical protein
MVKWLNSRVKDTGHIPVFDGIFEIIYVIGFVMGSVIRELYVRGYRHNKVAVEIDIVMELYSRVLERD